MLNKKITKIKRPSWSKTTPLKIEMDPYEQWRRKENFSYFTNRDHFGLQGIIHQIRNEQRFANTQQPPPGFHYNRQPQQPQQPFYYAPPPSPVQEQVFYTQPFGFYTNSPQQPPPPQPPLIERNINPLQTTDLNVQANPWTPEVSPSSDGSFFDFDDCDDVPLEENKKSQKKRRYLNKK